MSTLLNRRLLHKKNLKRLLQVKENLVKLHQLQKVQKKEEPHQSRPHLREKIKQRQHRLIAQ